MSTAPIFRHKHLQLDQTKLTRAKTALRAKTETEAIERALSYVVDESEVNEALTKSRGRTRIRRVFR